MLTDDGRYDYIDCAGRNGLVEIPGTTQDILYDYLTSKGTRFPQFRILYPWCGPSRANILTGQLSYHNGVTGQGVGDDGTVWDRMLFKDLHDGGIQTGVIGKISNWLLGDMVHCPDWVSGTHYLKAENVKDPGDGGRIWTCINVHTSTVQPHLDPTNWRYPVPDGVDSASIGETGQKRWDHWVETFDENGCVRGDNTNNDGHIFSWAGASDWSADHNSQVVCDMVDEFVDRPNDDPRQNQPFFIMCNYHDPHGPNQAYPPYPIPDTNKRQIRAEFYKAGDPKTWPPVEGTYVPPWFADGGYPNINMEDYEAVGNALYNTSWCLVAEIAIDDGVKKIIDHLAAKSILENTIVIFVDGDNGRFVGEHGIQEGKQSLYDDDMKTTLIIRGPGFPAGKECDMPVFNLDLNYTIRSILGVDPANGANGPSDVDVNLRDVVSGAKDTRGRLMMTYSTGDGQYGAMWGRKWKYFKDLPGSFLFDIENDPYELNNLYGVPFSDPATAQAILKTWHEDNFGLNDPGPGEAIHYESWPPGNVGGIAVEDFYANEDPVHDP